MVKIFFIHLNVADIKSGQKNIGRIRVNIYVWKIYMPLYTKCCHPHKVKSYILTCICTYFNTNNQYEGEVWGGGSSSFQNCELLFDISCFF